jgi:hypothetical protein
MKHLLKLIFLYILVFLAPLPLLYILVPIEFYLVISAVYALSLLVLFLFVDKFLLKVLNAKEIIETEKDEMYQLIKHQSFKNSVKSPKLFSYRGQIPKIFLLKGNRDYTLVFEESVFDQLSNEEVSSFVNFLLVNDRKGNSHLLSVVYLLGVLTFKIIFLIRDFIYKLFKSEDLSKAVFLAGVFFSKPMLYLIFWYSLQSKLVDQRAFDNFNLKSAFMKLYSLKITESFTDNLLVTNQLVQSKSKIIDASILEIFPSSYIHLKKIYD